MRWKAILALFLLAWISPSSCDGSQSAGLPSTTDPPTADIGHSPTADAVNRPTANSSTPPAIGEEVPDTSDADVVNVDGAPDADAPSTTAHLDTEDYNDEPVSERKDAGNSTTLADGENGALQSTPLPLASNDDANSEGSPSLAGEASSTTSSEITTITSSEEDAMESEARSSSTSIDPSDEPSQRKDEDPADAENDEPSSNGDRQPKAEASIGSHEDNKPQPSGGGSTPTINTTELKNMKSSELKTRLNLAELRFNDAKATRDKAQDAWQKKNDEAIQLKRDYEKKKNEWEKLEKIAKEKGKDWTNIETAAKDAKHEYDQVKETRESLDKKIPLEQEKLDKYPEEIRKAKEEAAIVKGRPQRLSDLKSQKKTKEDGKPALDQEVTRLTGLVRAAENVWDHAHADEVTEQDEFDRNNCNEIAKAAPTCPDILKELNILKEEAKTAKEPYDQALGNLKGPKEEQANYDEDMRNIQLEINKLDSISPNYDSDLRQANKKVTDLEGEQNEQNEYVGNLTKKQSTTVDEEGRLEGIKDAAELKVAAGIPPETKTAQTKARNAKREMKSANNLWIKIDKTVQDLKADLDNAQTSYNNAESEVKLLKDLYDKAKEREDEAQSSKMRGAYIGGGVSVLLLLIGVGVGVGLCYFKKCCCWKNIRKDHAKLEQGNGHEKTPLKDPEASPKTTSTTKAKKSGNKTPVIPTSPTRQQAQAVIETPTAAAAAAAAAAEAATAREQEEHFADPLPNLATVPFKPGEKPFKIPAKNFKWRGVMKRRTRWHGAPKHDFAGVIGVSHVDKIWFDPNANYATEIGDGEIMEDGGPPSDSDRSEWLNNLDDWERGHARLHASGGCEPTTCCVVITEEMFKCAREELAREAANRRSKKVKGRRKKLEKERRNEKRKREKEERKKRKEEKKMKRAKGLGARLKSAIGSPLKSLRSNKEAKKEEPKSDAKKTVDKEQRASSGEAKNKEAPSQARAESDVENEKTCRDEPDNDNNEPGETDQLLEVDATN